MEHILTDLFSRCNRHGQIVHLDKMLYSFGIAVIVFGSGHYQLFFLYSHKNENYIIVKAKIPFFREFTSFFHQEKSIFHSFFFSFQRKRNKILTKKHQT